MSIQRYRFDREGEPYSDGSIPIFTDWAFGPTLAGVRNCDCGPYGRRTVYLRAEPGTYFSQPAAIRVRGKTLRGHAYVSSEGITFQAQEP